LGNAYARRGLKAEAGAVVPKLNEHVDKAGVGRYEIALIYAALQLVGAQRIEARVQRVGIPSS